jgi:7-cyano-7-deazaguanine synthase
MVEPIILLFSGGLDSTVLLYDLLHQKDCVPTCLLFDYGQRHIKELTCARAACAELNLECRTVSLQSIFSTAQTFIMDGKSGSYIVPNRNMVFLSIAAAFAASREIKTVLYACNLDDAEGFPDCRPAFVSSLNASLKEAQVDVEICIPYISKTKKEIVAIGRDLRVNFDDTWSCYSGGLEPCGTCLACKKRQEALA